MDPQGTCNTARISLHQICESTPQPELASVPSTFPPESASKPTENQAPASMKYPPGLNKAISAGKVVQTNIGDVLRGAVPETPNGAFFTLVLREGKLVPVRVRIPGKSLSSRLPACAL